MDDINREIAQLALGHLGRPEDFPDPENAGERLVAVGGSIVVCWSCDTGDQVWEKDLDGVEDLVTVEVSKDLVFVMSDHGSLTRISLLDGEIAFHQIHAGGLALTDQVGALGVAWRGMSQ